MQLDFAARELTVKLVYYGPALSGKTTNLQVLHERATQRARGRLMTLETRDDRTLFFDLLPLSFHGAGRFAVRLKVFTVPGQVIHSATRRLVVKGADGVVFVADSRIEETENNSEAFLDLRGNLQEFGRSFRDMPLVIQFNKQDLPNARSAADIRGMAAQGKEPVYLAVATRGEGVVESFLGLLALTWNTLDVQHDLRAKAGIDPDLLLAHVAEELGETRSVEEILDATVGGALHVLRPEEA